MQAISLHEQETVQAWLESSAGTFLYLQDGEILPHGKTLRAHVWQC